MLCIILSFITNHNIILIEKGVLDVSCGNFVSHSHIREDSQMKLSKIGAIVLGIWLILKGIMPLLHLSFSGSGTVMAILAIAAGVLILLGR